MGITMTKQEARDEMKRRRALLAPEERDRQNREVCRLLMEDRIWEDLQWFYPFISVGTEIDTLPMLQEVFAMQRQGAAVRVAAPRVCGREMDFYEIHSLEDLEEGRFGIREPLTYCRKTIADHGLMLLPGLAFDLRGGRVGYGGGYYDRYLSRHGGEHLMTWAVAYDFQLLDEIETERHDISPQRIITPKRTIVITS